METYRPNTQSPRRPTAAHTSDRTGTAARALWSAALLLAIASTYRPAHAELRAPAGEMQIAGRNEDSKAWPRPASPRTQVPAAASGAANRAAARADRERPCHPDRSKCWRK